MKRFWKEHMILSSVLLAEALGALMVAAKLLVHIGSVNMFKTVFNLENILGGVFLAALGGTFFCYPLVLTAIEIFSLFKGIKDPVFLKNGKIFDLIVFVLGVIYTPLYGSILFIRFDADWTETLANAEVHAPIFTGAYPTVILIALIAVGGYLILTYVPADRLPPLVIVCGIAAMYLGIAECALWVAQVFTDADYWLLCLAPFDFIVIAIKTVRNKILAWNPETENARTYRYGWLKWCNSFLAKAARWPVAAFIVMWPLLGILICILVLLGQEPDAVIKAWTQSSDWNLSRQVAPQNIYYDEHYLCTVAAGGHKKVVKPLRLGVRHGHQVIVNRQLCVANAFEQILEERTPRFHRRLRDFYDAYGFPVAKAIRSPYAADVIYFVMKPLEWFFLIVIYLCDVKPENRIAVQYMGKQLPPLCEREGKITC